MGFFLTPILGSVSDGCKSQLGRRRPFIILLSIGIILGLILVPNGQLLGRLLGDVYKDDLRPVPARSGPITTIALKSWKFPTDTQNGTNEEPTPPRLSYKRKFEADSFPGANSLAAATADEDSQDWKKRMRQKKGNSKRLADDLESILAQMKNSNQEGSSVQENNEDEDYRMEVENERIAVTNHPWGLIFTVVGTVLLDFDADACQSPSRAYMLDVTIPGKL